MRNRVKEARVCPKCATEIATESKRKSRRAAARSFRDVYGARGGRPGREATPKKLAHGAATTRMARGGRLRVSVPGGDHAHPRHRAHGDLHVLPVELRCLGLRRDHAA